MLLKTNWFIWDAAHHRVFVRCYQRAWQSSTTCRKTRNQPENDSEYSWAWNGNVGINAKALLGMSGSCDSAFQEDVKAEEVKVHYFRMDKLRFERLDVRESSEIFWCCICFGNSDPDTLICNPNPAIDATLVSSSAVPPSASLVTGLDGTP